MGSRRSEENKVRIRSGPLRAEAAMNANSIGSGRNLWLNSSDWERGRGNRSRRWEKMEEYHKKTSWKTKKIRTGIPSPHSIGRRLQLEYRVRRRVEGGMTTPSQDPVPHSPHLSVGDSWSSGRYSPLGLRRLPSNLK